MADLDSFGTPEEDFAIRGEIETSSVPELVRQLLVSGEAGVLTFRSGEVTKSVALQQGRVVFASSTNPDERLGESLLVRGKLTARQYVEASKLIRAGRRLGAILVEMQAIEPEDLIPALEQQVKDILLDLFTWTHGSYEMVIKDVDPGNSLAFQLSTENLLLEGIRRTRSWTQIMRSLGSIEAVLYPTASTEVLYKLELTPDEQEILSHVNGRHTVEQICDVSYLPNYETCRTLWAFSVLGLARRGQAGEAGVAEDARARERELDLEEIVEKFNQMFGRIYGFLKGRIAEQVDEFMDGALAEVSRQYGALFDGVDLRGYGRADYEQMLANVADLPADQRKSLMVAALNELVFVIQLSVRTRYGAQEEAVVSGLIKDGFRKLGAG